MPERFKVVLTMQGAIQVLGFTFTREMIWNCVEKWCVCGCAGDICWRYLQGSWVARVTDDIWFLTNQNMFDDKMANNWTLMVQRHDTVTQL